jgi:hypothetical protein
MRRSAGAGVPLAPPGCGQVNTRQEQSQLGHRELDPGRARNQVGPAFGIKLLKGAGLEPLVPDDQAVMIPEEDLDPIAAAIAKDEGVPDRTPLSWQALSGPIQRRPWPPTPGLSSNWPAGATVMESLTP